MFTVKSTLERLVRRAPTSAPFAPHWLTLMQRRGTLPQLAATTRFGKRCVDVVGALILLTLLAPALLIAALAVRLTSPGPAIFKQVRIGLNARRRDRRQRQSRHLEHPERRQSEERRFEYRPGRPFVMYKLRTMRLDAEKDGAQLAVEDDPRVTRVGYWLRRTRLDEVPQLWNVLRGDMTLVGPRPERPEFIAELSKDIPGYIDRLGLKPGLTGLAQVVNGYDSDFDSFRRKVSLDLLYLQNCCLRNDLKILWRTIGVVITGKGAL